MLAGCPAPARLRHCGFWAHEGYAGLGETLLALRRGSGGKVVTDFGSGLRQEEALALAIQSDGRTVVVG